jgi:hypothetical protein
LVWFDLVGFSLRYCLFLIHLFIYLFINSSLPPFAE